MNAHDFAIGMYNAIQAKKKAKKQQTFQSSIDKFYGSPRINKIMKRNYRKYYSS